MQLTKCKPSQVGINAEWEKNKMKNKIVYTANSGVRAELNTKNFIYYLPKDFQLLGEEIEKFYDEFKNYDEADISWHEGMTEEEAETSYLSFFDSCNFLEPATTKLKNKLTRFQLENGL